MQRCIDTYLGSNKDVISGGSGGWVVPVCQDRLA
jgi:hypothetical protein